MRRVTLLVIGLILFLSGIVGAEVHQFNKLGSQPKVHPDFGAPRPPISFSLPSEATVPIKTRTPEFLPNLMKAVNALYVKTDDGSIRFTCTTTNIQELPAGKGYLALTAKHCVKDWKELYIQIDPEADIPLYHATTVLVGNDSDFAVVEYHPGVSMPVIPIGTNKLISVGNTVLYIGEPMNAGKMLFHGYVAQDRIAPEFRGGPYGWSHNFGLQIPAAGGSSGSSIIDPNQEAIVGVLVSILIPRNGGVLLTTAVPVADIRTELDAYNRGVRPRDNQVHTDIFDLLFGGRKN